MGYKETRPTTYLVCWPEVGIVKAGYTARQRWRKFLLRGAHLLQTVEFDSGISAFELETQLDDYLRAVCEPAFHGPAEAEPYLGTGGGGWLECYRLPPASIAYKHCLQALLTFCLQAYARTYVRTYVQPLTLGSYLTLGNARARVRPKLTFEAEK